MPKGHILVDLDATLADDRNWQGLYHIGQPIPRMVQEVQQWLRSGYDVRIFTARLDMDGDMELFKRELATWCNRHIGKVLPVTRIKGKDTIAIVDDRAWHVHPNTGIITPRMQ